jgi:L-ascorbate metabolism protein UlaG (beta-lactamase superfamily)
MVPCIALLYCPFYFVGGIYMIEVIHHASIKITTKDKIIYFDPYDIKDKYKDADYIFITHNHYDHYDCESINNVKKDTTKIIVPNSLKDKGYDLVVEANKEYVIDNIKFNTIASYNINKEFHPKKLGNVGYNILLDNIWYYIMGDTDRTLESDKVKTDICFVPIGGVYTMDVYEAINYINDLKPKKVVPIHYGKIVGDVSLGNIFKEKINKEIEVELFIK